MRLSHLVFALTLITYSAMHVGLNWSMDVVWYMLIVGAVLWILEGLIGLKTVSLAGRRNRNEA